MASGCLAKVVCSDAKHNFLVHYLLALAVILASPLLFSIRELDSKQAAQPLEMLVPLIGIILLTPVFMPEQNESIRDVVRSKKTSYSLICLLRLLMAMAVLLSLIGAFVLYMRHCGSAVTFRHFTGSAASAAVLGAVGLFGAAVSDDTITGYMSAVIYFITNFLLKDKLGIFYIFSMSSGSFAEKKWLVLMSVILTAGTFTVRSIRN